MPEFQKRWQKKVKEFETGGEIIIIEVVPHPVIRNI
jgi:hypothetical protein